MQFYGKTSKIELFGCRIYIYSAQTRKYGYEKQRILVFDLKGYFRRWKLMNIVFVNCESKSRVQLYIKQYFTLRIAKLSSLEKF